MGNIFSSPKNISTGSLKLHDVLSGVQEYTDDFAIVVDEYLDSIFNRIQMPVPYQQVNGLVLTGKRNAADCKTVQCRTH